MKFGFIIPHNYGLDDPQDVVDVALRAEVMGFDSVWVNHHVLHAGYILDRLGDKPYYDALTVLTYVAALTEKIRLGTTVLVLPYLNPLVLAKSLATLDVMSRGRLIVGAGVGSLQHESESLGSDFENRGAYADEAIEIMKNLWIENEPEYSGKNFNYSGVKFSPKPFQKPHPPIYIGGQSRPAMRRAAKYGNGWHPIGVGPKKLSERLSEFKLMVDRNNRKYEEMTISVRDELDVLNSPASNYSGSMVGNQDQLIETIEEYIELGVSELVLSVSTDNTEKIKMVMENFSEGIMPRFSD